MNILILAVFAFMIFLLFGPSRRMCAMISCFLIPSISTDFLKQEYIIVMLIFSVLLIIPAFFADRDDGRDRFLKFVHSLRRDDFLVPVFMAINIFFVCSVAFALSENQISILFVTLTIFTFFVFVFPRIWATMFLNYFLATNTLLLDNPKVFFAFWGFSVILVVFAVLLDLPEAREILWVFKPRKKEALTIKKKIVSYSTTSV